MTPPSQPSSPLPPDERALAVAKAAIAPADWERFAEAAVGAKERHAPRAAWEEMLLQAVLFYGFPRVVTAFGQLADAWPAPQPPAGDGALPRDEQPAAGHALFDAIYAANADGVHAMLRGYHPEFHDFVLESAYGRILARPGLPARLRELLAVTALGALGQRPQLIAHGRGALHFGASVDEVEECLVIAGLGPDAVARGLRAIAKG